MSILRLTPLAEDIRKMGEYAPYTLSKFSDLRTVEPKDVKPEPKAMAKELLRINDALIESIAKAHKRGWQSRRAGDYELLGRA